MTSVETSPVDIRREIDENLDARVRRVLPDAYGKLEPFDGVTGQQKSCYHATWGGHDVRRFLKAEVANGRTRDIDTLTRMNPDEALAHGISPILDYHVDEDLVVTAEPDFEGARTLREIVEQDGPIKNKREFEEIFGQVIGAVKYLGDEKGILHRDLHGGNILVRKKGKKNEVRLTDLRNAATSEDLEPCPEPTQCSRFIRDPLLDSRFTGQDGAYSSKSEAYAIGMNALVALTGKSPVEYDYRNGRAINAFTGESLIGADGKWSRDKHNAAIDAAIKRIPRRIRKAHGHWIKDCLTAFPASRWSNLESLANNFAYSSQPGFFESLFRNTHIAGPVATASAIGTFALVASLGYINWDKVNEGTAEYARALSNQERYPVSAVWDGADLEIRNNLFELEAKVSNTSTAENKFPEQDFVRAKPGEFLSVDLKAYEMPRQKGQYSSSYSLEGQLYLEGHELKGETAWKFEIYPRNPDKSTDYGHGGFHYGKWFHVELPKDLPEGTHILTAEIYAPTKERMVDNRLAEEVIFENPGRAIARKRIPIVVGNPERMVDVGEVKSKYPEEQFDFRNLVNDWHFVGGDTPAPKGRYFVASPVDGHFEVDEFGGYLRSQDPKDASNQDHRAYYFASYNSNGERISFTGIPLEREWVNRNQVAGKVPTPRIYHLNLEFPNEKFAQELLDYSHKIDDDFLKTEPKKD